MDAAILKLFLLSINVEIQGNGRYTYGIGEGKEEPCGSGWNYILIYIFIATHHLSPSPERQSNDTHPRTKKSYLEHRFWFLNTTPHKKE